MKMKKTPMNKVAKTPAKADTNAVMHMTNSARRFVALLNDTLSNLAKKRVKCIVNTVPVGTPNERGITPHEIVCYLSATGCPSYSSLIDDEEAIATACDDLRRDLWGLNEVLWNLATDGVRYGIGILEPNKPERPDPEYVPLFDVVLYMDTSALPDYV